MNHISLLEKMAGTSNIAIRKVALKGKWWEEASEPIVAFEKETGAPVSLIPNRWGKYPGVDTKRAGELQSFAYSYYPLLPEGSSSLMKLALKGLGKTGVKVGLLSFLTLIFALIPLFATQWIINHIYDLGDVSILWQISWGLTLAALSSTLFLYLRSRVLLRLDGLLSNRIQPAIWHRVFQLQISLYRRISKTDIYSKVTSFENIHSQLGMSIAEIFLSTLFSTLYFAAMFFFSTFYTLLVLPVIAIDLWVFLYFIRHHHKLKNHIQGIESKRGAFLSQCFAGLKKVRSAALETHIFSLWKKYLVQEEEMEAKLDKAQTRIELTHLYLPFLLFGIILGAFIFQDSTPPLGNFFAFYLALLNLCLSMREMTQIIFEMRKNLTKLKKSHKILEEPIEKRLKNPGRLTGEIVFPNFHVAAGERIGLKTSTPILELLGFEPMQGDIFLGEDNLAHLDIQLVRQQIGVVFRTDGLFAGNIYENIDVGRGLSYTAVEKALRLSGFKQDVDAFPMGLYTLIPAHGDTLSGGQKQRLLLARALVHEPSILILDHALDCLDPQSLDAMMERLRTLPITQIYVSENVELFERFVDVIKE